MKCNLPKPFLTAVPAKQTPLTAQTLPRAAAEGLGFTRAVQQELFYTHWQSEFLQSPLPSCNLLHVGNQESFKVSIKTKAPVTASLPHKPLHFAL